MGAWLAARTCHRTVVPLAVSQPRLRARGRGALRNTCRHGRHDCLGSGLLHEERLLIGAGNYVRGGGVLVVGGQTGQLSCQGGELIQRVVDQELLGVPRQAPRGRGLRHTLIGVGLDVWDLVGEVVKVVWFLNHHGGWTQVDQRSSAVVQIAGFLL